jgi:sec-independent protein translocase protein TatA
MVVLAIGYTEIIIVALVILLLFGGKKIPELMRGLGKGVKSYKEGLNGKDEEEKSDEVKSEK